MWTGAFDTADFIRNMEVAIERGFTQAWKEGAKECGVNFPSDATEEEQAALEEMITTNISFLGGFASAIERGSKANGGRLKVQFQRAEMWVQRYQQVKSQASIMACGDKKLKWVLDPGKENCTSCQKLNGKVKRASFWTSSGILPAVPGAPYLECHGFNCGCVLEQTDDSISRGPLPRLP